MARIILHNHMTRSVGRFRATAAVHDHGPGGCHCGGGCDDCKDHKKARDQYAKAELGIDVTYAKGPMDKKLIETRHYSVPGVTVDPRGYAPSSPFVAGELRRQPGHKAMVLGGWTAEKAEGYYKREQRDVGKRV